MPNGTANPIIMYKIPQNQLVCYIPSTNYTLKLLIHSTTLSQFLPS